MSSDSDRRHREDDYLLFTGRADDWRHNGARQAVTAEQRRADADKDRRSNRQPIPTEYSGTILGRDVIDLKTGDILSSEDGPGISRGKLRLNPETGEMTPVKE